MKIKLIGQGMESFTGQMGVVDFVDGVSVNDVSELDAVRISAVFGAERIGEGESINIGQRLLDNTDTPAVSDEVVLAQPTTQSEEVKKEIEEAVEALKHTEESLSKIADEQGIAGIREVADKFGLKGNSISGLIQAILKKQG